MKNKKRIFSGEKLHKITISSVVLALALLDIVPVWGVTSEYINPLSNDEGEDVELVEDLDVEKDEDEITEDEITEDEITEDEITEDEITEETKVESLEGLELEEDNGENKKGEEDNGENKKGEEDNEKSEEIEEDSLEGDTNTNSGNTEETGISLMSFSVQNVGSYTPRTKQITGHATSEYDDGEFRGTLERYVMSGSPADTKTVTGQTSANYNKDGYTGTLTQYLESGLPSDTKHVTGQTSANYNKDGYTGTLTQYVASGSYTPSDTKYVSGQTSQYYNSGGYTGTLTRYLAGGSSSSSKYVTNQTSSYYSDSSGYSGSLSSYTHTISSADSKYVSGQLRHVTTLYETWEGDGKGNWKRTNQDSTANAPATKYYNSGGYSGTLSKSGGGRVSDDGRPSGNGYVYLRVTVHDAYYAGTVYKPAVTATRYRGTVYTADTRYYRYRGDVTRPASDTRQYAYEGNVTRPDTRVYKYEGNVSKPDTRVYGYRGTVYEIDKDAPVITIVTDGNSNPRTSHSTVVNVKDEYSGVELSQYQWTTSPEFPNGGTWTPFTSGDTITRSTGTDEYYLHIVAVDNEGNISQSTSKAFNVENTPPKVPTLVLNTTGYTNQDVIVTINYENDLNTKQYKVGNGSWQNYTSPVVVSSNDTVYARETSRSGLTSDTGSIKVTNIDKSAPNGTITGNPTSWTNSNITLTFNATDTGGSGVRRVRRPNGTWVNGSTTTHEVSDNGTYVFTVEDNAGNTRDVSVNVNRIDKTLPNGTITGNPTTWVNSNQTLTFNATDAGGSGVRRVRVKGGTWVNGATTTQVATQNGSYAFEVEDNAGNTREVSVEVNRIDKALPNGTITGNPTAWTNSSATLNFTATDTGGSGVSRVRNHSGTWTSGATTSQTVTSNGTYTFRVEDGAGNIRDVSVTVNRIDTTSPTVTFGTNGSSTASNSHSTTVSVADTGSGVSTRQYQWTTSTATPTSGTWTSFTNGATITRNTGNGNHYLHIRSTDVAGNTGNTRSNAFNLDTTAPTSPTLSASTTGWTNGNVTVTATYPTDATVKQYKIGSGSWLTYTTPVVISSNSTVYARGRDSAGNWSTERSLAISNIDKTLPNGTITGNPTTWTNSNQVLSFTATDSGGSGVRRVRIKDGTWVNGATTTQTVSANGTYTFTVEDNAGNTRDVSVTVNRIDKTLPNGTITGNPTSWVNSNQTLTFNATDTGGSGVRRVRVKGGTWVNGATTSQVATQNGTYVFEVEDNAGNTREVSVTVNRIDKTLPNGTIAGNPTSWVNSNQTLTFTATDAGGSGVRRVRVKNGSWVNGSTTTLTVSTNGTYAFEVEDNAGNTREVSVEVNRIDKTLPTVTLGTNGNSTPRKSQSTTVNVTDTGSGVATRQYQWTTSTTFPTSGTWTNFANGQAITQSSGTGKYYLHIRTSDVAGNTTQVTSNVFEVDNTAPIAPTYTPSTTGWTNGNVTVTINYPTDANIKEYRVGSGTWGIYTSTVTLTSNNTIFARAFDLAGNESSTSSLNVTNIDKVAPVLNVTGNPIDWDERDEITLSVVTSDALSGVRRITLPDNKVVTSSNTTYKVSENGDYVFKVEDNAGNITTRTVTVDKLMIHYYLYIYDSKGNPVKDSTFELLRDGKVYRTSTTDDKGYIDFGKVPPVGKYTLRQVTNSDGIDIKDPVEIDQDVNDPIEIENPVEYPVGEILEEPVLTRNLNTWTNKDVTVTITYSGDSTIKQYKINDGGWEEYTQPINLSENAKVYARSYDDVGNWSPETSLEVTVIDKVNPNVEIEINTEDWVGDKVELTVIAKDGDSGVQTITSNQGLERISQETKGDTVRSTYLVKNNGNYEFTVTDTAGNMVTETYTVNNIDKEVPEIEVNGNPDDWFREYELNLEIITTDNHSGVKQVTLPDGTVVTGQDLDKLTYKVTDNGSYEFIVEDNVGNKTTYTEEVTRLEKDFSIKVTDTDNKPLAGAEFELYRDGELIETVESDNSGLVEFGTVYTSGDYEIRQTRAPEGYRLNNKIQVVDVADDDITITNYHQSEVLPSTGTMETLIMLVMGLATITVITVTNKKRRKLGKVSK